MPASGSPVIRRRELGALLRTLRTDRGWSAKQVAERLVFSVSKVSRLETGKRGVSPHDIQALCDLYEVSDDVREQLTELAAEGKQQAWWQSHHLPYSPYVGLESEATSISDFGLALIPGLLQTADYARETMSAIRPDFGPDVIEQRVAARLGRQRILTSDNPPRVDAIIDEVVLHRMPSSQTVVKGQLEQLVALSRLSNVSVRILPFRSGLLPSSNNKFIILTFDQHEVPTTVFIESLTEDWFVDDPGEVQVYLTAFSLMQEMSQSPDQTRETILAMLARLRD